jgi:hypothetical protein
VLISDRLSSNSADGEEAVNWLPPTNLLLLTLISLSHFLDFDNAFPSSDCSRRCPSSLNLSCTSPRCSQALRSTPPQGRGQFPFTPSSSPSVAVGTCEEHAEGRLLPIERNADAPGVKRRPTDAPILLPQPLPAPIAAVQTLAELVSRSDSNTIQELLALLRSASAKLEQASFNPVSTASGTALFMRFLTLQRPPPEMSFREFKAELVERAREFVQGSGRCRELIAHNMSEFIKDGSVRSLSFLFSS